VTIEDLIQALERQPAILACGLLCPALLALLLGFMHGKRGGGSAPWKYVYMILVYAAAIPGMFACVLTAYALLFRNANLLTMNMLVYFLPIVAMAVTLILIHRNINSFDEVPGFDRLSGLMVMLAVSFAAAFVLHRMHFGIVFFGTLGQFVIIAVAAFAMLKWATGKMAGSEQRPLADALGDDATK
jgi:hypothetical protein